MKTTVVRNAGSWRDRRAQLARRRRFESAGEVVELDRF
jgi:hypothetical protein